MSFRTAYGYARSENGWRMCDRNECGLVRIAGLTLVDTAPLRNGDPLIILGAWLRWYDLNVEVISTSVWGWSNTNDVGNSNHLSGTAVDVNAPRYPWGARTMPAERKARVRRGLALFEGNVFWGADWDRADEMHYQMAFSEGNGKSAAFARKLLAGHLGIYGRPKPPPAPTAPPAPKPEDDMTPEQDKLLREIARQLGPWDQLGKNAKGEPQTIVDSLAELRRKNGLA